MTTSRYAIRRENARDWPIFAGASVDHIGVLTVEVARLPNESMGSAMADAAAVLGASLLSVYGSKQHELVLLAVGKAIHPATKVAAFHAERDKLWVALEKAGVIIPAGSRVELRNDRTDGTFGFIGGIAFDSVELPKALELTRRETAVCIGTQTPAGRNSVDEQVSSIAAWPDNSESLLRASVERPLRGLFVARGFGQFDDATAGAEIFAGYDFLDLIEPILVDTT